jgi:hypothetical protein
MNSLDTVIGTDIMGEGNNKETFGTGTFQGHSNDLDLFFGGDMGIKWGARLHYSKSDDTNFDNGTSTSWDVKHSALGLGLGVMAGDIAGYANLDFSDKYEGNDSSSGDMVEADLGLNIGGSYTMGSWAFFADYDKVGAEATDAGTAAAASSTNPMDTYEKSTITVGAGYTHEVTSSARIFTDLTFKSQKTEVVTATSSAATDKSTEELKTTTLPLTVAFETDATSWLTLRGSLTQNVFINKREYTTSVHTAAAAQNEEGTNDNTTTVAAGATLTFGKLMIDGMIGTNGTGGTSSNTTNGVLDLDRLMTRVGVHYWF